MKFCEDNQCLNENPNTFIWIDSVTMAPTLKVDQEIPSTLIYLQVETVGGIKTILPVNITVSVDGPMPPQPPPSGDCTDAMIMANFTLIDQLMQDPTLSPLYATQANTTTPIEMAERVFTTTELASLFMFNNPACPVTKVNAYTD